MCLCDVCVCGLFKYTTVIDVIVSTHSSPAAHTHLRRFFWNFDAAENNCLMVVFFFGFRRCMSVVSNGISDASFGRDKRTAVNNSSRTRCRPANRDSMLSMSRQPIQKQQRKKFIGAISLVNPCYRHRLHPCVLHCIIRGNLDRKMNGKPMKENVNRQQQKHNAPSTCHRSTLPHSHSSAFFPVI